MKYSVLCSNGFCFNGKMENSMVKLVLDWYDEKKLNLGLNEWTVLSGIIAKLPDESFRLLSVGTGTKCLGKSQRNEDGWVIHDSHAEVLAKRAFQRYLHLEIADCNKYRDGKPHSDSILQRIDEKTFELKWKLYLYVSETPCGNASVYPIRSNLKRKRRITGAKPVESSEDRFESQRIDIVRLKSGRSDIPDTHRTESLSCTDKIRRWNTKGLQGSLLASVLPQPITFEAILVAPDPAATTFDFVQALQRVGCPAKLISERFIHAKSTCRIKSCAISINWYDVPMYWIDETTSLIEKTVNGLRQGGSKRNASKCCSRLCRQKIQLGSTVV